MSSWNARYTTPTNKYTLQYSTNQSGFASNFNNFLYTYLYAQRSKKPLYVYDLNNPISTMYHMLKDSFVKPSNIVYTDKPSDQKSTISSSMIRALTVSLSNTVLQKETTKLFRLTPEMASQIQTELSKYTLPSFDI